MSDPIVIKRRETRYFCFQIEEGGEVYKLPFMGDLPVDFIAKVSDAMGDPNNGMASLVDGFIGIFDKYCPGLTKELTIDELQDVAQAWSEVSGVTLGESQAPTGFTLVNTGRR